MISKEASKPGRLVKKKTQWAGRKPDYSPEAALRVAILLRSKKKGGRRDE